MSFILTFLAKFIAKKKSIIDIPNERSSHTIPTPRGGGIAIAISWFFGISVLFYMQMIPKDLYFALLCGVFVSCISILDDIYSLKAFPRLAVQSVAATLALYFLGGLQKIDLVFFEITNIYVLSILAFIVIIGFVNIYNFIDGIDGYAASEAIFISLAAFILINDNLLLILTFAVLGFIPWNWQKAKIFMGDVGSTLLGFTIAILAVYYQNTCQVNIFFWIIISSLFWFDAIVTILRRLKNKEKLQQAHRKHAYQRIVIAGFSHQKTVIYSLIINAFLFILAFIVYENPQYILLCILINIIFLNLIIRKIDKKLPFK